MAGSGSAGAGTQTQMKRHLEMLAGMKDGSITATGVKEG